MEPMKPSEALRAAKNLILDPDNWTQGSWSKNGKICAGEAMDRIFRPTYNPSIHNVIHYTGINCDWCNMAKAWIYMGYVIDSKGGALVHFNDSHSHAEVLALFDEAIAKAEAAGE